MTQPDMPSVMQAAERLRRLYAGEDPYGITTLRNAIYREDKRAVLDFALSILPKGERPVAIVKPEVGQRLWLMDDYDIIREVVVKPYAGMPTPWCFAADGTTFACGLQAYPLFASKEECEAFDRLTTMADWAR